MAKSDVTAPAYSSAAVDGSTLTMSFGEALATDHKPDTGDFTISGGATSRTVSAVDFKTGDATKLELTLSAAVRYDETNISLSYTPNATQSKRLQDAAANEVAAFTNQSVTNNTQQFETESTTGTPPGVSASARAAPGPQDGQITVSWTNPTVGTQPNAWRIGYRLDGSTSMIFTTPPGCALLTTVRSCTATGLTPGAAYDIQLVLRIDGVGERYMVTKEPVVARDTTAPALSTATVNGTTLVLTYGEALSGSAPPTGAFTVTVADAARTVDSVNLSGAAVTLTLASAVTHGEAVTVSYRSENAGTEPLRDTTGNRAANLSSQTVANNTPGLSVSVGSEEVDENAGTTDFTVTLDPASSEAVTVDYALGGTATHGTDYTSSPSGATGTLTFAANTTSQTVTVTATDDSDAEGAETITLTLSNPANASVVTASASTTIADDEVPHASSASVNGTTLEITFSQALKSTAAATPAGSAFTVMVGDAERNVASGGVSISGKTVTLTLVSGVAAGETVTVAYDKPDSGGKLQSATGLDVATFAARTVTNDTPPDVSVSAESATVAEPGGTATFTVTLSGAASQPVTVTYTLGGTATHGTDYTSSPSGATGTLTFAVGTTSQTITVTGVDDLLSEGAETITVTLSSPVNATLVTASASIDVADDERPHASGASVFGRSLVITFTEALVSTAAGRPAPGAFTVMVGGARRNVASGGVRIAGNTVVLTLVSAVAGGETVTVAYDRPASGGKLQNASALEVDTFGALTVQHATPQVPAVYGVQVNGDRVEVMFDRALAPNRKPSASRFRVEQYFPSWSRVSVRRVEIDPGDLRRLVLTLSRSVRTGAAQPVRMSYDGSRDSNALRGVYDSERVRDFSEVGVPNLTPVLGWGDPGTERWVQSGTTYNTNVEGNDLPCGRERPGETRAEADQSQMYVCDTAQRKWTLAQFARPGVDYRSDLDIDWILVSDWGAVVEGRCILRGYDDLRGAWILMSTSWKLLCDRARAPVQGVEGQAMAFHVALKDPPAESAQKSVNYATVDGTAKAGEDYEAASGTLTFGPGEFVKTVQVRTLPDRVAEGSETMRLRLSNARGFTLSAANSEKAGTIVDAAAATPVEVAIVSDPGADRTYGRGDMIRVRIAFSGPVDVDTSGGTPRLKIKMDPDYGEKWAVYEGGSGTAELVFAFGPVAPPNLSPRGIAVLADSLEANGGTIRIAGTADAAPLGHAGLEHDPDHKVDHRLAPAPVPASAEAAGAALTLVFDAALDTDSAPAGSAFAVTATDADDASRTITGTGTAAFGEADGEVAVTLESAVAHGETLTVAYAAPADSPLQDSAGNRVANFDGVAAENLTAADGRPAVASVALTSTPTIDADGDGDPDTYARGETVEVTVTWNADVTWDLSAPGSTMRVRLDVGGATKGADLAAGGAATGTARSLAFRYAVHRTDAAPDGVFPTPAADGSMVVAGGGATLKGADGRHAHRAHAALAADPAHKVDGGRAAAAERPSVTGVAITSAPRVDADGDGTPETYGRDESIEVTVTWDADVTWDLSSPGSTMRVRLDVGGATKGADLASGGETSGTARSLAFRYAVHRTDRAPDGVFPTPAANGSLVVLGGGATLKDAERNDAPRAHAALAADANHRVDGARDASAAPPEVIGAALVSDPGAHGVYGRDDVIRVGLTFSEAVDVDTAGGTPFVLLKFDRDPAYPTKAAVYESGSGSDTLVFAFGPVAAPNHSSHGVALLADTLAPNGGTIRSADSLQDAALSHAGLGHDAGHRIDSVLPFVESAAVDGNVLTVVFDEDLDPNAPPSGRAFTVMAGDGAPRRIDGTGTAPVDGAAATVALASDVRWGETLRAYYDPDGVAPARDLAGNPAPALLEIPAANNTPRPNRPATGAPTITGLAQVGQTLTASADGVADADGMDGAVLAWQWMSSGGGADEDIAGATASTYALAGADEGRTVRVRVSFTDDAGFAETLSSSATEPVAARPLTAALEDVPQEHGGKGVEFSFGLVFSDDFPGRFDYKALRGAFVVENGRAVGAKRAAQGQNQRWTITVRPWSHEAVSVSLPAGSVETESGRPLANTLSATLAGPPGVSVADAEAEEGAGAVMEFAVTLDRAPRAAVSVDWATSDGTAKAGEDYEAGSGTLAFAAGATSGTVSVALLDDVIDDDGETFRLVLSNPTGAHIADGEATGTIKNSDPLPRALLARFGRAAAVHVVDTVEERMTAPRTPGFEGRVAGREVRPGMEREMALGLLQQLGGGYGMAGAGYGMPGLGSAGGMGGLPMMGAAAGPMGMGGGMAGRMGMGASPMLGGASGALGMGGGMGHPGSRAMGMGGGRADGMGMGGGLGMADGMGVPPMGGMADPAGGPHHGGVLSTLGGNLLAGSSFSLNRETRRGGILSLWSRGAHSTFFGQEGELGLSGDVRTTMFGADYASGPMTVGLSLARSWGLGAYNGPASGEVASSVTGLYPWLGYRLTERLSVWGVGGYGRGGMLLSPGGATRLESGLSMKMMAAGTRGELVAGGAAGFTLAFKADALRVVTASDEVDGPDGRLAATSAAVSRLRTALEGSRGFMLRGRLSLTPSVEVGLRHDAGDAEQGAGMDVGGGLVLSDAKTGLTVDVRVRTLLVHEAEGFSERGASVSLSWNPSPQTPLGLTAKVAPSWGGQAMGGAEALWGRETMAGMAQAGYAAGDRLDAELGYGLPLGSRFVGTPLLGVSNSAYGRDYRLGYSIGALETESVTFELGFEAQRRENAMQGEASTGALGQASLGW